MPWFVSFLLQVGDLRIVTSMAPLVQLHKAKRKRDEADITLKKTVMRVTVAEKKLAAHDEIVASLVFVFFFHILNYFTLFTQEEALPGAPPRKRQRRVRRISDDDEEMVDEKEGKERKEEKHEAKVLYCCVVCDVFTHIVSVQAPPAYVPPSPASAPSAKVPASAPTPIANVPGSDPAVSSIVHDMTNMSINATSSVGSGSGSGITLVLRPAKKRVVVKGI